MPSNSMAAFGSQIEQVETYLARMGLSADFDFDVALPDEEDPFYGLFLAVKVASENLRLIARERDDNLRQLQEQIELISNQGKAIVELSTPVTEVWDGILILPLIGMIDTARAQQIVESLLEAIVAKQTAAVIMDITGVPVVDTAVANHLLNTIAAAKMLGAEVILTGVSPHNAQTLVKLGVNLGQVTTKSSLQAGLKLAFAMTMKRVVTCE